MMDKPNIIIFNPEHFRFDALSHSGNPAASTPNFDKIREKDGVSFKNAFSQSAICVPSRCSFMSGWYPHVKGHRTMFNLMNKDEPVLLRALKDNGYIVWWAGKNDLIPGQNSLKPYCDFKYEPGGDVKPMYGDMKKARGEPGSDTYYSFYVGKLDKGDEEVYYDADWDRIEATVDFIRSEPKKPMCIFLPLSYAHPPFAVEDPWYSRIDREKTPSRIPTPEQWKGKPSLLKGMYNRQNLQNWSEERWREMRATYLGMVSRVDHQFGMVMEALRETNVYEETAVFVFGDHGNFVGDYGLVGQTQNTFEDSLLNVPFLIKPPAWIDFEVGTRECLVELVDFPATVEDLSGIEPQHTHFGRSLLPVIRGERENHREAVFGEGGRLKGERHCMELESRVTEESLYWPRVSLQKKLPEHTKAVMVRDQNHKYVRRFYEKNEFYDLKEDPEELENKIDDPKYEDIINRLKERLIDFYLETGDAVLPETDERWTNQRW